jgi:hypothetical protein
VSEFKSVLLEVGWRYNNLQTIAISKPREIHRKEYRRRLDENKMWVRSHIFIDVAFIRLPRGTASTNAYPHPFAERLLGKGRGGNGSC